MDVADLRGDLDSLRRSLRSRALRRAPRSPLNAHTLIRLSAHTRAGQMPTRPISHAPNIPRAQAKCPRACCSLGYAVFFWGFALSGTLTPAFLRSTATEAKLLAEVLASG
jgi:hypothetical protein